MENREYPRQRIPLARFGIGSSWLGLLPLALAAACLPVLFLVLSSSSASAETPSFGDPRLLGGGGNRTTCLGAGDLDGDGDIDVVVGNYHSFDEGPSLVHLNSGDGTFDIDFHPVGTLTDTVQSLALGDLDGDGDLDLVLGTDGYYPEPSTVWLNDGDGTFDTPPSFLNLSTDDIEGLALGDVDGDGDLDIVAAQRPGQNAIYVNDGDGTFDTTTYSFSGSDLTATLGDLDGDGDLDLVTGEWGQNYVHMNDGSGHPFDTISYTFGTGSDWTRSLALGDLDGDGDLDVAVGNDEQWNAVYMNDGSGNPFDSSSHTLGTGPDQTFSVALGDMDGDGDLDIVVGDEWNENWVYINDGDGTFDTTSRSFGTGSDTTRSVVLADVDGDGDLDIISGNLPQENVVYLNNSNGSFANTWDTFAPEYDQIYGLVLGDVDGDGDLDIVAGEPQEVKVVYFNDGDGTFDTLTHTFGIGTERTYYLALGDVNGDSHLDVVAGHSMGIAGQQNRVYLNDGDGTFDTTSHLFGSSSGETECVALGDVDGDGDLDITVGNNSQQNMVYLNDGDGTYDTTSYPFGTGSDWTHGVALGDMDGDGDLDIVAVNYGEENTIHFNRGDGTFSSTSHQFGNASDGSVDVALGDVDGDGDLDVVVANDDQQNAVYLNYGNGTLDTVPHRFGISSDLASCVNLGDVDGDGDLDIFAGNIGDWVLGERDMVHMNDGDGEFRFGTPVRNVGTGDDITWSAAMGDVNGDGILDIVVGAWPENVIYLGRARRPDRLSNNPPTLAMTRPGSTPSAGFFSTPEILDSLTFPIQYTLFDAESDPVRLIRAFYSPDGGGRWLPAAAASGTVTTNLAASPSGTGHTFTWDASASGFFGQADNVVFRIEAYPSLLPTTDAVPGPFHWPYAAATTFPFRVRGTQVRVLSGTLPVAGAIVYRLPAGQSTGGLPISDSAGRPFHTDPGGFLQGRGELGFGDKLVALLPISHTDTYTIYYTSASPTPSGLDADAFITPGVQTLVVSYTNPLVLFDLDLSLEWDGRNDQLYMDRLIFDLRRTSEFLYDWTDGQVALGTISIFHDRDHWVEADVQIHATNRLRPNAGQGGIVSSIITDPVTSTLTYAPGQVRIGAVWNRYGEPGGGLGEDWPRTLAHELGHYLLFLDDNYIGIDDFGQISPVDSCPGAMSDAYRTDFPYDEFHPDTDWLPACERTLSHQITGRSDWATIATFYPWLFSPSSSPNSGPSSLPLNVTSIRQVLPPYPATALEDPTFYLSQAGERIQPGRSARAFLFQGDRLTDLGAPTLDQVLARGARPDVGDQLCVFELAASRLGCESIISGDEHLELVSTPGWLPDLVISPFTSRTIAITLTNVPTGLSLSARLFPVNGPATIPISLTQATQAYTGTFTTAVPALAGYVRAWVNEPTPRREIVTDYSLGGSPGTLRANHGGPTRGLKSPAISADGQVILFGEMNLQKGDFFTLQAATLVPSVPPWMTLIGQAYRLSGSANAPDLSGASISFAFIGDQVPPGEEDWILMYYWDGSSWLELPTQLDTYHNTASALVQGEGLYALMSSFRIPLHGPGWNLFSYPVQTSRPVSQALLSISGAYTTVYGYEPADTSDPWKVYDVTAPAWVNDLKLLEFAHGYWINVSQAITMYLKGDTETYPRALDTFPTPPATFYGHVLGASHFSPTQGMTLTAFVGGHVCGRSILTNVAGYGLAYTVNVLADGTSAPGCGAPGRQITFAVDSEPMIPHAMWNNTRLWNHSLRPRYRVYLPITTRQYTYAPDLIVHSLIATSNTLTITIANQGPSPTADPFWVDAYIDPLLPPTHVNQTWDHLSHQGLVWGITSTLQSGDVLTLTVGGPYFRADLSYVAWPLPASTPVYAQVDSASAGSDHGAVLETHEIVGTSYNNIAATTSSP